MIEAPQTISTADVRARFDLVAYAAQHYGGEPEQRGDTVRMVGDHLGGLEIEPARGVWYLHAAETGGDCFDLVGYRTYGTSWDRKDKQQFKAALAEAAAFASVEPMGYRIANGERSNGAAKAPKPRSTWKQYVTATYEYTDGEGRRYYVDRTEKKSFPVWHVAESGEEAGGKGPADWALYHLEEVTQAARDAKTIFVCEGEKDADNLRELGFVATTAPGGSGGWDRTERTAAYAQALTGADVVLLPDNDEAGLHCMQQARVVLEGHAKTVRTLDLPGRPENGGDASDWIESGGTADELITLVDELEPEEGKPPDAEPEGDPAIYYPRLDVEPPRFEPVLTINGTRIGSIGNCSTLVAGAASGKSAACDAIVAKGINPKCEGLGIEVELPPGKGIVYVDTERTQEDHWDSFRRAMHRAGITKQENVPVHLRFCLLSLLLTTEARKEAVLREIIAVNAGLVIVDGIGDFVVDPNDAEEVALVIGWFLAMAKRYGFCVLFTLHPNPNDPDKGRGHLGTDLWRRGDSYLTIVKDPKTEQRTISSKGRLGKVRRGPDVEGFFRWDEERMMFVMCDNEVAGKKGMSLVKLADLTELLDEIYQGRITQSYSDLWRAIESRDRCSKSTAKRRVGTLIDANLIVKMDDGTFLRNGNEVGNGPNAV